MTDENFVDHKNINEMNSNNQKANNNNVLTKHKDLIDIPELMIHINKKKNN